MVRPASAPSAPRFAAQLRAAMDRAGLRPLELARRAGTGASRTRSPALANKIRGWLRGEIEPQLYAVDRVAVALGVSLDALVLGDAAALKVRRRTPKGPHGREVFAARLALCLSHDPRTQRSIAAAAGLSRNTPRRWLRGKEPGLYAALAVAGALGVKLDCLLGYQALPSRFAARAG